MEGECEAELREGQGGARMSAECGASASPVCFDGLPPECVAIILSKCCPKDAGNFSRISRTWAEAEKDEDVWSRWARFKAEYSRFFPDLAEAPSGRDAFHALRRGVFSASKGDSCHEYLLTVDPSSGSISLHVSAFRCLYFYQRNDTSHDLDNLWITPYGLWPTSIPGSTFENTAALSAGLFHIKGEICPDFPLPPGKYSISFRVAKPPPATDDTSALFPAVCIVNNLGEPDPVVSKRINLHSDGDPSLQPFPKDSKHWKGNVLTKSSVQEPEFWAKSQTKVEKEQESAWEAINNMILKAYTTFDAESALRMRINGERVKPWKQKNQDLAWEEFLVGEVELKDDGEGSAYLAVELLLTDVESYTFSGAIWLDSVVISQNQT